MDIRDRLTRIGATTTRAPNKGLGTTGTSVCPVLDTVGNPLVMDGIYTTRGGAIIEVIKWVLASGNVSGTYYRVWYISSSLHDSSLLVRGEYPNGIFSKAVYQSTLTPV